MTPLYWQDSPRPFSSWFYRHRLQDAKDGHCDGASDVSEVHDARSLEVYTRVVIARLHVVGLVGCLLLLLLLLWLWLLLLLLLWWWWWWWVVRLLFLLDMLQLKWLFQWTSSYIYLAQLIEFLTSQGRGGFAANGDHQSLEACWGTKGFLKLILVLGQVPQKSELYTCKENMFDVT